ncbi:MAG: hypothetical protein GC191_16265 [Azospirillum sp.]|nr:hypothetical protein [Azospirillum sp.]
MPIDAFSQAFAGTDWDKVRPAKPQTTVAKNGVAAGDAPAERAFGDPGEADFTFDDLIDILNPLQHLPVISGLYRDLTGDSISPYARVMGDILFAGGPIGAIMAMNDTLMIQKNGTDLGDTILAGVFGGDEPAKPGDTAVAALPAAASPPTAVPTAATTGASAASPAAEIQSAAIARRSTVPAAVVPAAVVPAAVVPAAVVPAAAPKSSGGPAGSGPASGGQASGATASAGGPPGRGSQTSFHRPVFVDGPSASQRSPRILRPEAAPTSTAAANGTTPLTAAAAYQPRQMPARGFVPVRPTPTAASRNWSLRQAVLAPVDGAKRSAPAEAPATPAPKPAAGTATASAAPTATVAAPVSRERFSDAMLRNLQKYQEAAGASAAARRPTGGDAGPS